MSNFTLRSPFQPTGDQPQAIERLAANLDAGGKHQTLLGVTGSGKTYTMANVIHRTQRPALVISHNKTLAAQLYEEFKNFFPENAVHYFVSYYDYYQPEAYIPQSDTYIEKDAKVNEMIDAYRHAATASVLTRNDVIIVASVSCIYGIGDPEAYLKASTEIVIGETISRRELLKRLVLLQYVRNPIDPRQGHFRVRENTIEVHLPSGKDTVQIELDGATIAEIRIARADRENTKQSISRFRLFPAKHFVTPQDTLELAIRNIKDELKERLAELNRQGKVLEAARLKQRTEFDLAMLSSAGYVNGIENYSRQLSFREPGTPPHTLIDYFRHASGDRFLTFIDESHATIPQLRGMYAGDRARKTTLVDYGFRLPSAVDNRPLTFAEFNDRINQIVYVSATPSPYELRLSREPHRGNGVVEQLIRPTGILDPKIELRPTANQIRDVVNEVRARVARGERSLVMALTKRLAEDIAEYLREAGINAAYLHSDIKTLARPEMLRKLRSGAHDVLVGINLLREGLDLPEVSFIAILDADKEGFLRNETTLLQIIGRAARHPDGAIVLYGDTMTGSMRAAINETERRREVQAAYNRTHGLSAKKIEKAIGPSLFEEARDPDRTDDLPEGPTNTVVKALEREMKKAARELNFELAARIRDRLNRLRNQQP